MLLMVSDANILLDIEVGELVATMFRLPYRFVVPDVLYAEELVETAVSGQRRPSVHRARCCD